MKLRKKPDLSFLENDCNNSQISKYYFNKRYAQQACMSNLLVTVFAARRIDISVINENIIPTTQLIYSTPTRKELTARPHAGGANTAP